MRRMAWQRKISITAFDKSDTSDENVGKVSLAFCKELGYILEKLPKNREYLRCELKELKDNFGFIGFISKCDYGERAEYGMENSYLCDDFNFYLNELYDIADDDKFIWIEFK